MKRLGLYCQKLSLLCTQHGAGKRQRIPREVPRGGLCGFPYPSGRWCTKSHSACLEHVHWEATARARIMRDRIRLSAELERLECDEARIRRRMRRRCSALAPLLGIGIAVGPAVPPDGPR